MLKDFDRSLVVRWHSDLDFDLDFDFDSDFDFDWLVAFFEPELLLNRMLM